VEAFHALSDFAAAVAQKRGFSAELAANYNRASTNIQLLGTAEQIQLLRELTAGLEANFLDGSVVGPLMDDLRTQLRNELNLELVEERFIITRAIPDSKSPGNPD